jgi:hypothetical protein
MPRVRLVIGGIQRSLLRRADGLGEHASDEFIAAFTGLSEDLLGASE